jgi:hypothetical protein
MGKLHDAIVELLVREVERRQAWDEPPQLYRLHLNAGVPSLVPFMVPLAIWDMDRPPEVLAYLAHLFDLNRALMPDTPDLHGMAFRHEGWEVLHEGLDLAHSEADRAKVREAHELALDHRLVTHPQRVEVRMMYAVDRAGITYQAIVRRGQPRAETLVAFPGGRAVLDGQPVSDEMEPTGAVLDALDQMVATLTGIPARSRLGEADLPDWLRGPR